MMQRTRHTIENRCAISLGASCTKCVAKGCKQWCYMMLLCLLFMVDQENNLTPSCMSSLQQKLWNHAIPVFTGTVSVGPIGRGQTRRFYDHFFFCQGTRNKKFQKEWDGNNTNSSKKKSVPVWHLRSLLKMIQAVNKCRSEKAPFGWESEYFHMDFRSKRVPEKFHMQFPSKNVPGENFHMKFPSKSLPDFDHYI